MLLPNQTILAVKLPCTSSTPHSKIQAFKLWINSFFSILSRMKVALKWKDSIGTQKGGVRVHYGTKFGWYTVNNHSYLQLFTKIKLSCLQATPLVGRSWKSIRFYWTYLLWFERNLAKDHKDTAKAQQCVIFMWSYQTNCSDDWTENWWVTVKGPSVV